MFFRMQEGLTNRLQYTDGFEGYSPLIRAIKRNRFFSLQQLLLKHPIDIDECDSDGDTPLMHAAHEGRADMVKILLEKGANPNLCNDWGFTPLIIAARQGRTNVVPLLLKTGKAIDQVDHQGVSALMSAASRGHVDIVCLLLNANANDAAKDHTHETALFKAVVRGFKGVIKLLAKPNTVNAVDLHGCTSLMSAAKRGDVDSVRTLVEAKADLNFKNHISMTALMLAAEKARSEVVNYLLLMGADATLTDRWSLTALHWACEGSELFPAHFAVMSALLSVLPTYFFRKPRLLYHYLTRQDCRDPEIFDVLDLLVHFVRHLKGTHTEKYFIRIFPLKNYFQMEEDYEKLGALVKQAKEDVYRVLLQDFHFPFPQILNLIIEYDAPLQHQMGFFSLQDLHKNTMTCNLNTPSLQSRHF